MQQLTRIICDPNVMGGRPCIRGSHITVGTVLGLMAAGRNPTEIMAAHPTLEPADITESLAYAAWRVDEVMAAPLR